MEISHTQSSHSQSLSLSVAVTVCQLYTNYTLTLKSPQKTPFQFPNLHP